LHYFVFVEAAPGDIKGAAAATEDPDTQVKM
jgi:hypothetical protein